MLQARAICRSSHDGRRLLRDVRFQVHGGDRVAVTGSTGSGKTLLLRALSLLDTFDSGDLIWRGKPVADRSVPEFRGQVMYLQQHPTLIEGSVEENLRVPFQLKVHQHKSFERDWFRPRLVDVGRGEEFLDQDVVRLSGGERQIVAVLRALAVSPSVLLLDEPTAALDPESALRIELTIQHWLEGSAERACVWVTHDAVQASRVGNRQVRMEAGSLIESDAPAET